MSGFPDELRFNDPIEAASFLARLGYEPGNVGKALAERFGLPSEDAERIAEHATQRERAKLDREAVEAEHSLDGE